MTVTTQRTSAVITLCMMAWDRSAEITFIHDDRALIGECSVWIGVMVINATNEDQGMTIYVGLRDYQHRDDRRYIEDWMAVK